MRCLGLPTRPLWETFSHAGITALSHTPTTVNRIEATWSERNCPNFESAERGFRRCSVDGESDVLTTTPPRPRLRPRRDVRIILIAAFHADDPRTRQEGNEIVTSTGHATFRSLLIQQAHINVSVFCPDWQRPQINLQFTAVLNYIQLCPT